MEMATGRDGQRRIKLTGTMAEIAALYKRPSVLMGKIGEHLRAKAKAPSDRRQDVIHPSEMARDDWCPRQTFYRIRDTRAGQEVLDTERFSMVTENIFAEGHSIHAKWQGWLREMGILHGIWQCMECDLKSETMEGPPATCWYCGSFSHEYREVPMTAEDTHMIVGHADGYIPDLDCLIEIKSIGLGTLRMDVPELLRRHTALTPDGRKIPDLDAIWRALEAPLEPHVRQAQIYLWLAKLAGLDAHRMVFLYEFKSNQQVKEFTILPDPAILEPMLASALDIRDAVEYGPEIPDRAHAKNSTPCKKCPFADECWNDAQPHPLPDDPEPESRPRLRSTQGASPGGARRDRIARPAGRTDAAAPGRRHLTVRTRPDDSV